MNTYHAEMLQVLTTAVRDWHLTCEPNVLRIIIQYTDFELAFEVFDRGLLVSPDFLEVTLRPSKKARRKCKGTLTSRLNGFLFSGKYAVMLEIPELGDGSFISVGVIGQIFDPLRRVGVGFGKDSWGYCFDGVFRQAGEVVKYRNKRRRNNPSKPRRTGKSLKAGDKVVLYVSVGDGGVKSFVIYLNGTRFTWPHLTKYLPYPLTFAVSLSHVDDHIRILPEGLKKWFGDEPSKSVERNVPEIQEAATYEEPPLNGNRDGADVITLGKSNLDTSSPRISE